MNGLPDHWALTPCLFTKSPYRNAWNTECPLYQGDVFRWYEEGRAACIGVRLGEISGGLLAVDFDGVTAFEKYKELSGGEPPVPTVTITSGLYAHCQMFYKVPSEFWSVMTKGRRAFQTQKDPLEHLEFRWNNHQSIVYGKHPSGSIS